MARTMGLVAASRLQRGHICRAAEQFEPSPLFRRARDYCERNLDDWLILWPGRLPLTPQQVIGPGPASLDDLTPEERHQWAAEVTDVLRALNDRSGEPVRFVALVGQRTVDLLARTAPTLRIETPLSGLSLGARVRWYDARLQVRSRVLSSALSR